MSEFLPFRFWIALLTAVCVSGFSAAQTAQPRGVQVVSPATASSLSPVGPYYALVIGNNNYQHVNQLQTAVNDARAVAQMLREGYGFQTRELYDATRSQILTALDDYRSSLPEQSNLLIYYAGHGHKDVDAHRAYWLPVDADRDHTANWINAAEITDALRAIRSRHVLIISDSCWSGDLTMRVAGAAIMPSEHNALLAKVLSLKSRHIMASGGDEPVADAGASGHSVFAGALLESLGDMEDDTFTAEALLSQRVKPRVAGRSGQTPQYDIIRDSDADLGDFVFFRSKNIKASASLSSALAMIKARKYYAAKQYEQALPLLSRAAETGDGEAADYLGAMYKDGHGVARDERQAVTWFRKAADSGNPAGMFDLGSMCESGWCDPKLDTRVQAEGWYRKAAEAGHATAMTMLGIYYAIGLGGLPKDEAQAAYWYRKAADAGEPSGMCQLGYLYEEGRGVTKDEHQAVEWFRKAADAGNPGGMYSVGREYENGLGGLPKDDRQALKWYRKAAEAGFAEGMFKLGSMYENGRGGLPKDIHQAVAWYRKAAVDLFGGEEARQALQRLGIDPPTPNPLPPLNFPK